MFDNTIQNKVRINPGEKIIKPNIFRLSIFYEITFIFVNMMIVTVLLLLIPCRWTPLSPCLTIFNKIRTEQ